VTSEPPGSGTSRPRLLVELATPTLKRRHTLLEVALERRHALVELAQRLWKQRRVDEAVDLKRAGALDPCRGCLPQLPARDRVSRHPDPSAGLGLRPALCRANRVQYVPERAIVPHRGLALSHVAQSARHPAGENLAMSCCMM
jgi:hypothetical protein